MKKNNCRDFNRILLKLSGEALRKENSTDNISPEIVQNIVKQIKKAHKKGKEIALVVGGGNFWRGLSASHRGMERATADYMGMLATCMNSLAILSMLEKHKVPCRVQSAIDMENIAEPFIRKKAIHHLKNGRVVIFAAGTGNPYFSTDTAAALRASEISADAILKATNVDGIYTSDPNKHDDAQLFNQITYFESLKRDLKVLDSTAFSLCRDNEKKLIVFNMLKENNIYNTMMGHEIGTLVTKYIKKSEYGCDIENKKNINT